MSVLKVLGGIACLSVFIGTGALAEMGGSNAAGAKDMIEKQSKPKNTRSDAEKVINSFKQQDSDMVAIGGEAIPVEDLAQQTRKGDLRYFN